MKILKSLRARILLSLLAINTLLISSCAIYAHLTANALRKGVELVPCHVKHTLGFYCPGCGGSRALIMLFRLDIITSFVYNPIPILCALLLLIFDITAIRAAIKESLTPIKSFNLNLLLTVPAVTLLHFVLRLILLFSFGIDPLGDILG